MNSQAHPGRNRLPGVKVAEGAGLLDSSGRYLRHRGRSERGGWAAQNPGFHLLHRTESTESTM